MANDSPNPYAAPGAGLTPRAAPGPGAPPVPAAKTAPSPGARRFGAVVLTLLAHPLSGAGFYLLGRGRLCAGWTAAGLAATALMIIGVRTSQPVLFASGLVALIVTTLWALVGAFIVRPADLPATKRAWIVAIALLVASRAGAVAIEAWLSESFENTSGGMIPTLLVGDRIFIKKGRSDVGRGEAIVFKFSQDRSIDLTDRVIAVGGDTVAVHQGVPSVNGIPLDHQEIAHPCSSLTGFPDEQPCKLVRETNAGRSYTILLLPDVSVPDFRSIVVPDGEVFVMSDNRDNAYDSRRWGPIKVDLIEGKPTIIWWSTDGGGRVRRSRVGRRVD